MELNRKTLRQLMLLIAFAIVVYLALSHLGAVAAAAGYVLGLLAPFLVGLCIAFVLNAPMRLFEQRVFAPLGRKKGGRLSRLRRPLSLIAAMAAVAALLALVLFLVIPELVRTIAALAAHAPAMMADLQQRLADTDALASLAALQINWQQMIESAIGFLKNGASDFLNATVGVTTSIFSGLFNFILGLIFSIYVLFQKEKLAGQLRRMLYAFLPERHVDRLLEVGALSNRVFSNFVGGQCVEAVIIGLLCFLGMTLLRLPYAMMISVLVGFTALIPVFGAFIGTFIGAFLILTVAPIKALIFLVFIVVLQQVEGNLIYPHVVGSSVGLPGIWVMMAVTIGGSTMGILGMLLSVPVCSILYCLLREAVGKRLQDRGISTKKLS